MATHALRAKTPGTAERLHAFATVKDAAKFLHPLLRRGDLVLVKGTINADHLGRLVHHWLEPISCWRMACGQNTRCDACSALRAEVAQTAGQAGPPPAAEPSAVPSGPHPCRPPTAVTRVIRNPGPLSNHEHS